MFTTAAKRSVLLGGALLGLLWAGWLPAQARDREAPVLTGGHASGEGRSVAPAGPSAGPVGVHAVPSGPAHATSSGRVATPMAPPAGHSTHSGGYDPGFNYGYYYNPYYRYYSYGLCGNFYGLLYSRYSSIYPDLFLSRPSGKDLHLTDQSVKAALRDTMGYMRQLIAAYENLKGLSEGSIGANLSPQERKREMKAVVRQIRHLSGQIKDDPFIYMLDQRKDTDILKASKTADPSADIEQLGRLIASLKGELDTFSKSPNAVSVKSFAAPSVRSLAKGIDKLAKRLS